MIHNGIKYAPELAQGIGVAAGLDLSGGGVERLSETIHPVLNPWGMPEWAWQRREKLCGLKRLVAAGGAGTFGGVALSNTTPGMIVVLEAATGFVAAAGSLTLYVALDADVQASFGSSQQGYIRDTRWNPVQVSQAVIRYGTPAAVPTARGPIDEAYHPTSNSPLIFSTGLPVIIHPGQCAFAISTIANVQAIVNFGWRERKAFPGELA